MPWLPRFVSLVFLVLASFALPQQAAAQTSTLRTFHTFHTFQEGDGTVTLPVTPSAPIEHGSLTLCWALMASGDSPATVTGPNSDLVPDQELAGLVIFPPLVFGTMTIPVVLRDDELVEGPETFALTIVRDPDLPLPPGNIIIPTITRTVTITDNDEGPAPSVLIEPRRIGAVTALRRHAGRFDNMTVMVVHNRLDGRGMKRLNASENPGHGAAMAGGRLGETPGVRGSTAPGPPSTARPRAGRRTSMAVSITWAATAAG